MYGYQNKLIYNFFFMIGFEYLIYYLLDFKFLNVNITYKCLKKSVLKHVLYKFQRKITREKYIIRIKY